MGAGVIIVHKGADEMDSYITGATIKNLREKKGITQAQLADLLGSWPSRRHIRTAETSLLACQGIAQGRLSLGFLNTRIQGRILL